MAVEEKGGTDVITDGVDKSGVKLRKLSMLLERERELLRKCNFCAVLGEKLTFVGGPPFPKGFFW